MLEDKLPKNYWIWIYPIIGLLVLIGVAIAFIYILPMITQLSQDLARMYYENKTIEEFLRH